MPRLHPVTGDIAAGIGGGDVSINGRVVATNAGGICWLDHRAIFQIGSSLYTCTVDGLPVLIDPLGAVDLAASAGVFAANYQGVVRVSNRAETYPGHGIGDVGPDGTVLLRTPDGKLNGQLVADIQAHANGQWSGLTPGPDFRPIQSAGLAPFVPVDGPIYGLRRAQKYGCYLTSDGRFVVQHQAAPIGKVLARTLAAYRPDMAILPDGRIEVVFATGEAERPEDVRVFVVRPDELTVDLRVVTPKEPDKPKDPEKPKEPQKPKEPPPMALFETLQAERAKYPTDRPLTAEELGALLNAVAWAHRAEGILLFPEDGDTVAIQPRTRIKISSDVLLRRVDGVMWWTDALTDAEGIAGVKQPHWAVSGDEHQNTFVTPVAPLGTTGKDPERPIDPPKVEPSAVLELLKEHTKMLDKMLGRQIETNNRRLEPMAQEIAELRAEVRAARAEMTANVDKLLTALSGGNLGGLLGGLLGGNKK